MKLINDLYNVFELTDIERGFRCRVKFNDNHIIYKAHFPGNPITPGVCLVQIALEILELKFNNKFELIAIQNIKFKRPVVPMAFPEFLFEIKNVENETKVYVSVEEKGDQYTKMILIMQEENVQSA